MEIHIFPNPSRQKVPARLKYKAVVVPAGKITSAKYLGIGYGPTKAAAKRKAMADYRKTHK